jgi:hypothetical protein
MSKPEFQDPNKLTFEVTRSVITQNFMNLEKNNKYSELQNPTISAIADKILFLKAKNNSDIGYYLHIIITFINNEKKNLYFLLNDDNDWVLGGHNIYEPRKFITILKNAKKENIYSEIDYITHTISSVKIAIIRYEDLQADPYKVYGGKSYSNIKYKEVLGKKMRIYKIPNSRKEHVKYKGDIITLAEYRKLVGKKSNSKKVLKAKKSSRSK